MNTSPAADRLPLAGALLAALAGSLCCVLPFVLVSFGITGSWLARLQLFAPYRIPFDVASVAVLAVAWGVHVLRVRSCRALGDCALPQRLGRTRIGLLVATFIIGALVAAPYIIAYFGRSLT